MNDARSNMANNGTPATTVPQTSMSPVQVPTQMQMQMPVQYQGTYNTNMTTTQPFPWQNQQQQQQQQIQQQMPLGQPMLMMNPQQSNGQGGMLWMQQDQQQHQQQQQTQGHPPDIYMQMAAILLNQAQQQQIQQRQIEQQQQHNQVMATAPTPSPWSQFPNGEAPVINPTNLAQIDANALISQIMNYGGAGSGWNNGQQMPQATTALAQPQQPFFPVSSSQPMRYDQASTTGAPNMHGVPGYQQPSGGQMQAANVQTEAQSMPSIFPTGGMPQNDTSITQQQDDPSFWLSQLQSLGLPDEIRINLQDDAHDEVLDDDLFDRLDGGNLGYSGKEE